MKRCCHCRETKPLTEFKRNRTVPDGYHRECKACCKARREQGDTKARENAQRRALYLSRREEELAYAAEYRKTDKWKAIWQARNAARCGRFSDDPQPWELQQREWQLSYQRQNRARLRENGKRWYVAHREEYLARLRTKRVAQYAIDPTKQIAYRHNRKARKLGNGGTFTVMQWRMLKARHAYTCLCCGKREPEIKLSPDHVLPLARGGANSIDNIQPLCASCNYQKHAKHIDYRPAP